MRYTFFAILTLQSCNLFAQTVGPLRGFPSYANRAIRLARQAPDILSTRKPGDFRLDDLSYLEKKRAATTSDQGLKEIV